VQVLPVVVDDAASVAAVLVVGPPHPAREGDLVVAPGAALRGQVRV
jgi:hypothetical protein